MATASPSIRRRAHSGSGSSTGLRANWFGRLSRPASHSNRSRGIDEVPSHESLGKGQGHSSRRGASVARPHDPITISVGLLENPPKGSTIPSSSPAPFSPPADIAGSPQTEVLDCRRTGGTEAAARPRSLRPHVGPPFQGRHSKSGFWLGYSDDRTGVLLRRHSNNVLVEAGRRPSHRAWRARAASSNLSRRLVSSVRACADRKKISVWSR